MASKRVCGTSEGQSPLRPRRWNATRDYLDVAALSHHLGTARSAKAMDRMQRLYAEFAGEIGDILLSVVVKLTEPDPYDLSEVDLSEYKGIHAPWAGWTSVKRQCRALAEAILKSPSPGSVPNASPPRRRAAGRDPVR